MNSALVSAPTDVVDVSVVVIGRNEGQRLARCLDSVQHSQWAALKFEVLYVDSASTDGSLALARSKGATALLLNDGKPNAAKARNLGWRAARGRFVLFLDGDTELEANFVPRALPHLDNQDLCAVWGHRRESRPQQSIYTRVLDLDWMYPPGLSLYFGGDVLVRRQALVQANGFDPSLNAGEEPELCARLRGMGWSILHIDEPMTRHDLAISTLKAWARRSYRSGIAYAEVAWRMSRLGDGLWQHESRRDLTHGLIFVLAPVLLAWAAWQAPMVALMLLMMASALLARTVARARWRAPDLGLVMQYAVHVHLQKVPALAGQLAWHWAHRQSRALALVDYKGVAGDSGTPTSQPHHAAPSPAAGGGMLKRMLAWGLSPLAWLRREKLEGLTRIWAFARLRSDLGGQLDASNVVLGVVHVDGTRRISIGRGARISAGVHLETQGEGRIVIGNDVVLSAGVHIVAFDRVDIGDGVLIGEYSSVRDANHRLGTDDTRRSGHDSARISIGRNVWLGRGVTVLKGVHIGANSCIGANAVVTRSLPADCRAVGAPAHALPYKA